MPLPSLVGRRRASARIAVLALIAGLLWAVSGSAAAAPPTMTAAALNTMWGTYGNQGGHWTGGDSTVSAPLPGGRVAWLFSDTYLGTVNTDHSRPAGTPRVSNTLVVQQGTARADHARRHVSQDRRRITGLRADGHGWRRSRCRR